MSPASVEVQMSPAMTERYRDGFEPNFRPLNETERYLSFKLQTQGGIQDGTYRIVTQGDDQEPLHLATESGFVKAFPASDDQARAESLWKITRVYTSADSFNINSPVPENTLLARRNSNANESVRAQAKSVLTAMSTPKYRIENVGSKEFLGLSRSRLILVTTKDSDNPLEVEITASQSSPDAYRIHTTLPDEVWGTPEEYYVHVGVWQLTPEGKPVVPSPVLLASEVFPESDCVWRLESVDKL
ncbi:hypothetical protein AAF712_012990 [Marasmius tenuissimus]|uniref:Uncharacterized protein n=1 Tax=Marasmius tenuissimus TaxID=585030 RepID=A0ABR2ZFY0_9AGAR